MEYGVPLRYITLANSAFLLTLQSLRTMKERSRSMVTMAASLPVRSPHKIFLYHTMYTRTHHYSQCNISSTIKFRPLKLKRRELELIVCKIVLLILSLRKLCQVSFGVGVHCSGDITSYVCALCSI